ncbi:GNAT family N-acetyltransferase [Clostridium senegalense]|uniref:GNAT family N-acetyltransferase n=1 Tax=Clostridium senegalense TaxID=1465809 RepID=UPI001C100721|nr:GNAT family N-acetyltransferase [Clostridium senegalense]MBU5228033.1 GNAT family N-acetyltransferase [Clostridium senegalense]
MKNLVILEMKKHMLDQCVDLFINTFSKEPWNDVYDSRDPVVNFFNNHFNNNYFLGYVAMLDDKIVALSVGMKKPWIEGMEYYIDQFCVSYEMQGKGIGSWFMKEIEKNIKNQGMNGMILNTEKGYPAQKFYEKNDFKIIDDLIVFGK